MNKPRLLIADDHTLMAEGLTRLLDAHYSLIGTVEDGFALIDAARRLKPDVILTDITMPGLNGIAATRQIKNEIPDCQIVILTMHADPIYAREAFRAGASGYVLKGSAARDLIQAIRTALKGQVYASSPMTTGGTAHAAGAVRAAGDRLGSLTSRQREVLQLVAGGYTGKEMASTLGISVKTVEYHKAAIMERLRLRTTAELTKYAINCGLTSTSALPSGFDR